MSAHQQFPAPPLPSVPPAGAPALMVPKALLLTQSRRLAAALPTRPRQQTAAVRAEKLQGAALKLLLQPLPPKPVAVVGLAAVVAVPVVVRMLVVPIKGRRMRLVQPSRAKSSPTLPNATAAPQSRLGKVPWLPLRAWSARWCCLLLCGDGGPALQRKWR